MQDTDQPYFDLFFRKVPDEGGFAIAAGLEQAIEYIQEPALSAKTTSRIFARAALFGEDFLDYLNKLPSSRETSGRCRRARRFSPKRADSHRARTCH